MGLFSFFQKKKELPPKSAFTEKRLLPRWKITAQAKIKWPGALDYVACEVRDLNMRGFCLVVKDKIPKYDTQVELYFNDKYFFNVEISVTWHKEADGKQIYGIKFLRVRDSDREKIYQMMKENFAGCFGKIM
ncbi:MAG TPA: PilZ domain-containing protein [Candidatus Omnitrophota bacterium]|nr:PilZ domain-containing protein [Candidatus Omnitrophota bacterium]HPT39556.1 PilZ domain-containing protein [Candidatus Omnitrophota bacterium]